LLDAIKKILRLFNNGHILSFLAKRLRRDKGAASGKLHAEAMLTARAGDPEGALLMGKMQLGSALGANAYRRVLSRLFLPSFPQAGKKDGTLLYGEAAYSDKESVFLATHTRSGGVQAEKAIRHGNERRHQKPNADKNSGQNE
jgi:hypothetical protein